MDRSLRTSGETRVDRRVAAGAFVLALAIALSFHREYWLAEFIGFDRRGEDIRIYYEALHTALDGQNPYGFGGLLYHPASLLLVSVVGWLPESTAVIAWFVLNLGAWSVAVYLGICVMSRIHDRALSSAEFTLLFLGFAAFAPAWRTFHNGQINAFVALTLVACLAFALEHRDGLAGVALACAVVLKTSPALLGYYLLATRNARAILASLAAFAALTVVSAAAFYPGVVADYLSMVDTIRGEYNVSGANQNVVHLAILLDFVGVSGAERAVAALHRLGLVALLAVIGWPLIRDPPASEVRRGALFSLLVAIVVVASPLVWYHHSTLLLIPLLFLIVSPDWSPVGVILALGIQAGRVPEHLLMANELPRVGTWITVFQHLLIVALALAYFDCTFPATRRSVREIQRSTTDRDE